MIMRLHFYPVIIGFILFGACTGPQGEEEKTLPMKVAEAYGYENMDEVESIQYTFNVQVDSATVRSRSWKWNVKSNEVSYSDPDTTLAYFLIDKDTSLNNIDSRFINDKYWLLFPFQLAWDTGYEYETLPDQTAPISGENSTKLTILYNNVDGYTPGDAYDLYLDEDNRIMEWVFRRGNGAEGRPVTWENVQEYKGIQIALDHKDRDGKTFLWFSDVAIN
jgi:hypothetical protein